MALIRNYRDAIYGRYKGQTWDVGATTQTLIPFASTVVSASGITKNSSFRITVSEKGVYEMIIPLNVYIDGGGTYTWTLQSGINSVFTTITTSASGTPELEVAGLFSIFFDLEANDYIELRSTVSTSPTNHIVHCAMRTSVDDKLNEISSNILVKRI